MGITMNVLVYGSSAREHSICWKILKSSSLSKLYLANPNDGFRNLGEEIKFENFEDLAQKAKAFSIDIAIICTEKELSEGIVDIFNSVGIKCIGPNKYWAQLESSKSFAKEFMVKNNIPTANYQIIERKEDLNQNVKFPIVVKADGLAGGKGVCIVQDKESLISTIDEYLNGKFGNSSKKIILEEYIEGSELSLMCFWDGNVLFPWMIAKDYKKLENFDKGPNTAGLGSYCPVSLNESQKSKINDYCKKLQAALINAKADFVGIIYCGLIFSKNDELKTLEYNMRLGDPEAQSIIYHFEGDLLKVFKSIVDKKFNSSLIKWKSGQTTTLFLAVKGYPYAPIIGSKITNLPMDCQLFFGSVKRKDGYLYTNGGRIVCITTNSSEQIDLNKIAEQIDYEHKYYRTDIVK